MQHRNLILLAVLLVAGACAGVLWRRNALLLEEMRNAAEADARIAANAPTNALPPGVRPALIEEHDKTRAMTQRDLQQIAQKTRAELVARPRDPDLHLQMAVAHSLARRFDDAADEVEKAALLAPQNAGVRGTAGMFYMRFGDMRAALPHLQKARELAPSDMDAVINLAKAHWERGEMDATLSLLQTASRLAGKSVALHEKLAGACTEFPLRPNAVAEWRKVLAAQPNHALALQQLAYYELDGGNLGPAKTMLQKAMRLEPNQFGLYSLMGTLYSSSEPTPENLKQAEIYLNKALELAPTPDSATHYNLGKVSQRRGDLQKAAQQMEQAVAIDPLHRQAHYDLAQIYSALKRPDDATRHRQRFQKIYEGQNRRNLVSRKCQTSPNDPQLQRELAQLFLEDKNPVKALPHLQKALELRPGWREMRSQITTLHRALGRPRRALAMDNRR